MDALTTREVARRTGLTARALRFYEARGLVRPVRTYAGARLYGTGELERLARVVALKRAGLTLAQIARVLNGRAPDLAALVDSQLAVLTTWRGELDTALTGLRALKAALGRGEALGVASVCEIINQGGRIMTEQDWKQVADQYFSPEEQTHWAVRKQAAMPDGFDQEAYNREWAKLGSRIAADLPMDVASTKAQAYLVEWKALLAPFDLVADDRMRAGAVSLWDKMDEWAGGVPTPFTSPVWAFIKEAAAARG